MTNDLKTELARIREEHLNVKAATAFAQTILDRCKAQIIGRQIEGHFVAAHLKGKFQITEVELTYDAEVRAAGRKVLSSGKLGSMAHDLGVINTGRLGL